MQEFDYIVVGSGFGGSVSALRLAQKGYSVLVVEAGRRYEDKDFPKNNRSVSKWLFRPAAGLHGIMRMSFFKDAFFLSGAGVGGGSLVYGNTLLMPPDSFYQGRQWAALTDWKQELAPHYAVARRMLGVTENIYRDEKDDLMMEIARDMGREHTYHQTKVGVYFGEKGKEVDDPFFGGEGPKRTGCTFCGSCMTGCRVGAKNTLRKNYLYFAERMGVQIVPETKVDTLWQNSDGSYSLSAVQGQTLFKKGTRVQYRAKGVVLSAGVLGTLELLLRMKVEGYMPKLSACLGDQVRTNSEAMTGAAARTDTNFSSGIAITSGFYPDDSTHVELVRYGAGSDMICGISTLLVGGGPTPVRMLKYTWQVLRHPLDFMRSLRFKHWAKRNMILLVMQNRDNHMRLVWKRRWYWPFSKRLTTEVKAEHAVPVHMPMANEVAERMAKKIGGYPVGSLPEVLFNRATTAHILGGAVIGATASEGVIDMYNQVFAYPGLYVVDGSMIPANLGVNPSLTITAMAERAMSYIPEKHPQSSDQLERQEAFALL